MAFRPAFLALVGSIFVVAGCSVDSVVSVEPLPDTSVPDTSVPDGSVPDTSVQSGSPDSTQPGGGTTESTTPAMLGQIFDGLQNPLPEIAQQCGYFLKRGVYLDSLSDTLAWDFTPLVKAGDSVRSGDKIGFVVEKIFKHYCMVPFSLQGTCEIVSIEGACRCTVREVVAQIKDLNGTIHPVYLSQNWPVKYLSMHILRD